MSNSTFHAFERKAVLLDGGLFSLRVLMVMRKGTKMLSW